MIHQFIFAGPKPNLSPEAFLSYWINFHAVDYAAQIPQIRRYLVASRLSTSAWRALPFFEGAAEIWFDSEEEQIASLQSPEFLQGARIDEPRWAAFWQTLVIDTDPQVLFQQASPPPNGVKLYVLVKRRPDLSLDRFREEFLQNRREMRTRQLGVMRHAVGFARGNLYGLGEPRFDAVETTTFADHGALEQALEAGLWGRELEAGWSFADPRYVFAFAAEEHWIIRPGER